MPSVRDCDVRVIKRVWTGTYRGGIGVQNLVGPRRDWSWGMPLEMRNDPPVF